jgi:tripartite motif-containing protein 71
MILGMSRVLLLGVLLVASWPRAVFAADYQVSNPPAPAGIAVDGEGNVYVSDYALDRLLKFGPDGTVLAQWGGSGSALGQFSAPFGVALDDRNTLFVVDQLNNRVQRFAADGSVLGAWGAAGAGASELRTPFGVAVSSGRVYVADFGNDRVQVFSLDGSVVTTFGARGTGEGQFLRPAGVAVDRDGSLYVTDHFNDRIEKFSGEGHFQAQFGTLQVVGTPTPTANATGLPQTPTPTLVGTPSVTATPSATVLPALLPEVQLRRPEGIVLDHDGNLWVADYGRDRVVKLTPDGRLLQSWGVRGSGPGEFVGPKGVAIDPASGRLYVADTGNARIQRLSPDGTAEATWLLPAAPSP